MRRRPASVLAVAAVTLSITGCTAPAPRDADLARWQAWSDRATMPQPGDLVSMGGGPSPASKENAGIKWAAHVREG